MRPSSSVHSSLRSAASVSAHSAALRNFAHIPKSVSGHFDSDQQHHTAATTTKTVPFVPLQLHIVKDRKHERRRVIEQREGAKRQCPGRDNRQIAADKLGRAESIELDGLKRFSRKLEASARLEEADIARLKQQGAERLNLYIDRQEGNDAVNEEGQQMNVTFRGEESLTTRKERWRHRLKLTLPHVGLVILSAAYTLLGAAIFHYFETPNEMFIRNATAHRVQMLKDRVIAQLWLLGTQQEPNWTRNPPAFPHWAEVANDGMNAIIRDVFIDYTKNYMTPDEIIYGAGPTKWSFGASVFFSWTAITTIGYGHIVPLTIQGRISCLLYALFGIPLILVTIADMGRFLSNVCIWVDKRLFQMRKSCFARIRCFCMTACCQICVFWRRRKKFRSRKTEQCRANKSVTATTIAPSESTASGSPEEVGETPPSERPFQLNHVGPPSGTLATIEELSREAITTDDNNNNDGSASESRLRPLHLRLGICSRRAQRRLKPPPFPPILDTVSEAGTFQDVSEIRTVHGEDDFEERAGTTSEDTRARADELEGGESSDMEGVEDKDDEDEVEEQYTPLEKRNRRVSALFILVVMLGYTAGGACLMQLWERWSFVDAFYFCFVTVTTIGFGDIVPQNVTFLPATLAYIVIGLIITTMCIDLVGSAYIQDIHLYGRALGSSFLTIGGKVIHLGEVFSYVAFLQKNYGLTPDQLDRLAQLPEEYLLDCLINGRQPDLNWIGGRPFIPPDIYYFKWIEQPRTLSFTSERQLASSESMDLNTSLCSTARTLTPREYYQRVLVHYCRQMQTDTGARTTALGGGSRPMAGCSTEGRCTESVGPDSEAEGRAVKDELWLMMLCPTSPRGSLSQHSDFLDFGCEFPFFP